jgi:thiol-disulfide isomerase/thioredoxin
MDNLKKNLSAFIVPLSIIVAGLLVSGAIFASQGKSSTETEGEVEGEETSDTTEDPTNGTFYYRDGTEIYTEDGKPVVALISTSSCPHCVWISDTYDTVVREYQDAGKIKAYHFIYTDSGLSDTINGATEMSSELQAHYEDYSGGYVPTFVIGGKYYRVGNAYESEGDLEAEATELRRIIDQVISEM